MDLTSPGLVSAAPVRGGTAVRLERAGRMLAAAVAVGGGVGLVVGGIGSRLAMRLLFLTTGDRVRGLVSDDGFIMGRFDLGDTLGLVALGAIAGVLGGLFYLAIRPLLLGPAWLRVLTCAAGAGAVVGAMLVHTDGIDFRLLGPAWLAIALFVAIPAAYAALVAAHLERAVRPDGWFPTAPRVRALAPLALLLVPPLFFLLIPIAIGLVLREAVARDPRLGGGVRHPATQWALRFGLVAVAAVGAAGLVRDIVALT